MTTASELFGDLTRPTSLRAPQFKEALVSVGIHTRGPEERGRALEVVRQLLGSDSVCEGPLATDNPTSPVMLASSADALTAARERAAADSQAADQRKADKYLAALLRAASQQVRAYCLCWAAPQRAGHTHVVMSPRPQEFFTCSSAFINDRLVPSPRPAIMDLLWEQFTEVAEDDGLGIETYDNKLFMCVRQTGGVQVNQERTRA